jgi:hypothetical protein
VPAYDAETDPAKRRVKGAMLAGALFNRANDIFRRLVDCRPTASKSLAEYPLVKECGRCLVAGASRSGGWFLHRSGEEGIDELWGEPFRLFSTSLEDLLRRSLCKRSGWR